VTAPVGPSRRSEHVCVVDVLDVCGGQLRDRLLDAIGLQRFDAPAT
jgi:hypothetical protein